MNRIGGVIVSVLASNSITPSLVSVFAILHVILLTDKQWLNKIPLLDVSLSRFTFHIKKKFEDTNG
jgi:hypothetical protein